MGLRAPPAAAGGLEEKRDANASRREPGPERREVVVVVERDVDLDGKLFANLPRVRGEGRELPPGVDAFELVALSTSPSRTWLTNRGKVTRDGPEKTKSTASTFFAMTAPIGASQFAPPITVTTAGFLALIRRARANDATFCWNIDVAATIL